jgi:catechol 2,3-dioxygenase-like lactoylglutathione lyase family enzyme
MKPKLFRVIVQVSDIDRAAQFYEQVLGIEGRRVSPGRHYFDCDGTLLACVDPQADGDAHQPAPTPDFLYFAVNELESTCTACRTAGATFCPGDVHGAPAGEIHKRPWGERSFYACDPFGNKICFVDRTTIFTGE